MPSATIGLWMEDRDRRASLGFNWFLGPMETLRADSSGGQEWIGVFVEVCRLGL